jgi:hypothetical protein
MILWRLGLARLESSNTWANWRSQSLQSQWQSSFGSTPCDCCGAFTGVLGNKRKVVLTEQDTGYEHLSYPCAGGDRWRVGHAHRAELLDILAIRPPTRPRLASLGIAVLAGRGAPHHFKAAPQPPLRTRRVSWLVFEREPRASSTIENKRYAAILWLDDHQLFL